MPLSRNDESDVDAVVDAGRHIEGTAAGTVQFRLDGRPLGSAVTVVKGKAESPLLLSATNHPLWPGIHTVTAVFTPSDPIRYASATASVKYFVKKVVPKLGVVVRPNVISTTLAPIGVKASGTVTFRLSGKIIGRVTAHNGVATLLYMVKASLAASVSASYSGNIFMVGANAPSAKYHA